MIPKKTETHYLRGCLTKLDGQAYTARYYSKYNRTKDKYGRKRTYRRTSCSKSCQKRKKLRGYTTEEAEKITAQDYIANRDVTRQEKTTGEQKLVTLTKSQKGDENGNLGNFNIDEGPAPRLFVKTQE